MSASNADQWVYADNIGWIHEHGGSLHTPRGYPVTRTETEHGAEYILTTTTSTAVPAAVEPADV